jgi:conjugal transfer pilus assembly protein TraD
MQKKLNISKYLRTKGSDNVLNEGLFGDEKHKSILPALIFIYLLFFLPGILIVAGLFLLTFFSSYNRCWWLGLAAGVIGIALIDLFGTGAFNMCKAYFTGFWQVLQDIEGISSLASALLKFWARNLLFVVINGFLIGGAISTIYYFVDFDVRDLRQQKITAWLKTLGIAGPDWKRVKTKRTKAGAGENLSMQAHPENGTLIGAESKKKVYISDQEANGHILLLGATGAGKTTTMLNVIESAAQRELPMIIVDAKGDPELITKIKNIAERFSRPFRVFSTRPESSTTYDPLRHGNALELTDKIISASDWTEPHYMYQAQRYLQIAFSILLAADMRPNMTNLAESVDGAGLNNAIRNIPDAAKADRYAANLGIMDEEGAGTPGGLHNRLAVWAENELSHLFSSDRNGNGIDLVKAINAGEIVLFSLDSLRYPHFCKMLGRLITIDLKAAVSRTYETKQKVYVCLDEFGAFANMHVADFINKSRRAGFHILISTQELVDLELAAAGLSDLILGNTNVKILHRQDVPKSAELLAAAVGTFDDVVLTHRLSSEEAGARQGTLTAERSFLVHPDEIKRLGTGQAFIMTKNPEFKVCKVAVRVVKTGKEKENADSNHIAVADQNNEPVYPNLWRGKKTD